MNGVRGGSSLQPDGVSTWKANVDPDSVHQILRRHLLADGFEFVLDEKKSRGSWVVDMRDGQSYLDLTSFYCTNALGTNHPALADDEDFRAILSSVALNKPPNSGFYTTYLAQFLLTFERVLGDPELPHLFFVEGGALAVDNALKAAFDWKSRLNEKKGLTRPLAGMALHLTQAFHGRSGYALSLTNTESPKTARYPKFPWPRIQIPAMRFPMDTHRQEVIQAERRALRQADEAFAQHGDSIACFIAEPIQGEGGDNHMRPEFLQAMQEICRQQEALFVVDEVQTGCGLTGSAWAHQQLGLTPDIVVFGKKLRVCGMMAGRRIDDIRDNVFTVPDRINSTWGGNLADMVTATRILEVIEADDLFHRATELGERLLQLLQDVASAHPAVVSNVRGRGLMCALDLPDGIIRARVIRELISDEHVLVLGCGERSLRLRPALTVEEPELELACGALDRVLGSMGSR